MASNENTERLGHNKYLGLRNFHIAPIGDIHPSALKKSAKLSVPPSRRIARACTSR